MERSNQDREKSYAEIQTATETVFEKPFSGRTYPEIMKIRDENESRITDNPEFVSLGTRTHETDDSWYWAIHIDTLRELSLQEQTEIKNILGDGSIPIVFGVRQRQRILLRNDRR